MAGTFVDGPMKTIAIIGASANRMKFGNKALRSYSANGYRVFPVHPKATEIEGYLAYRSVLEIPVSLDRISIYVPPETGIGLLEDIAKKGASEVWLNPGSGGPDLVNRARELGLNVIEGCSILDIGADPSAY